MSLSIDPLNKGNTIPKPIDSNAYDKIINTFIDELKNSSDLSKRMDAAFELGWLEEPKGVEALCEALKDPDSELRCVAAESLGLILIPEAVLPLCDALTDTDNEVRCAAANSLGEHNDIRSKQALIEALNDIDVGVRYASALALVRMDRKDKKIIQGVETVIKDPELRFNKRAVKRLKRCLNGLNEYPSNYRL